MKDSHDRHIDYMRISVTDRCNFRCVYCMPADGVPSLKHDEILRFEEILRIAAVAARLGISKFRVSGGEPLVRRGVPGLVASLKKLPGVEKVGLTTNGALLPLHAEELARAGLDSLSISLDTLDAARFREVTRIGELEGVVAGIEAAVAAKLPGIKINAVLGRHSLDELDALLAFASERKLILRFIEYLPLNPGMESPSDHITADVMIEALRKRGSVEEIEGRLGHGPSTYLRIDAPPLILGFITAVSKPFCQTCNRIRLTADGHLKPCLASSVEIDVRELLRSGAGEAALAEAILETVRAKPFEHDVGHGGYCGPCRPMSGIGG